MPIPVSLIESNFIFQVPLDPNGRLDYTANWGTVLSGTNQTILTSQWFLSDEAIAIGVEINSTSHDDTTTTIWLEVAAAEQNNLAYDADGVLVAILNRIEDTRAGISRIYDRTVGVRIKHQ